jgi:hypothetical protein
LQQCGNGVKRRIAGTVGAHSMLRQARSLFGIEHCFVGFLPKPDVSIDDQSLADWHHLREVHPAQVQQLLD